MRKLRVAVCGTTFGQFYCEALLALKDQFQFVGILANGSERSRNCAKNYNVRLFQSVKELEGEADLVCVVVRSSVLGGKGSKIAMELMDMGIHVIQEQPVHYKEIQACVQTSKKNHVMYYVGDLYKNLSSARKFIKAANLILQGSKPIYIDAGAASQVLFPLMEILSEALNGLQPVIFKKTDRESGPFHVVTADIQGIPVIFQVHNEVNPAEPDNYMHYLHRITIGTVNGRLCLDDINGSVCWYNRIHFPLDTELRSCFSGQWPEELTNPCSIELKGFQQNIFGEVFRKDWIGAIADDLIKFSAMMSDQAVKQNLYYARLIASARIWHDFTECLGYPELAAPEPNGNIDFKAVREAADRTDNKE